MRRLLFPVFRAKSLCLCFKSTTDTSPWAKNSGHCLRYQRNACITSDKHYLPRDLASSSPFCIPARAWGPHLSTTVSQHRRVSQAAGNTPTCTLMVLITLSVPHLRVSHYCSSLFKPAQNSPWQGFYPCWTLPLAFQTK